MRAKFQCLTVEELEHGGVSARLWAVYATEGNEENNQFNEATPSGELTMQIDNPATKNFFEPGKSYYLDITEAPA